MPARASAVRTAQRSAASSSRVQRPRRRHSSPQMERAAGAAEQAEQSGDDQIDGYDVVEQPRHDQNKNAGDQRDERSQTEIHVHNELLRGVTPPHGWKGHSTISSPGAARNYY